MKAVVMLGILAGAMSAQDFHGVSLGGTTLQPVLINNSDQTVIGCVIRRDTTTGISATFALFPSDRIMLDRTIRPGEQSPVGGSGLGATLEGEGDSTGYSLVGVLFADGAFVGPASFAHQFQAEVEFYRGYARNMQYSDDKSALLAKHASIPKGPPVAGEDFGHRMRTRGAGRVLKGISDARGAAELDKALARLASLPDVKEGNR